MTVAMVSCKKRLAVIWLSGSAIILAVLVIQTIMGKYGDKAQDAWSWFLPTIMPTLSLIIGVFVSDALGSGVGGKNIDSFMFRITCVLSSVYLILVASTLFLAPVSTYPPLVLMKMSNLWLGPVQGLTAGAMGVFFLSPDKGGAPSPN
jgi:hypothetical protein